MAKTTNGTSRDRFAIVCTEDPSVGYAVFHAEEGRPPDPDMLPGVISKSITSWVAENAKLRVTSTLPIIKDGNTVAVHLWYDNR